jgi:hypothetical protein
MGLFIREHMRRAATRSGVASRWPSEVEREGGGSAFDQWQALPDSVPASERMSALCIRAADWAGEERLRSRPVAPQRARTNEPECFHVESTVRRGSNTCKGVDPLPL